MLAVGREEHLRGTLKSSHCPHLPPLPAKVAFLTLKSSYASSGVLWDSESKRGQMGPQRNQAEAKFKKQLTIHREIEKFMGTKDEEKEWDELGDWG